MPAAVTTFNIRYVKQRELSELLTRLFGSHYKIEAGMLLSRRNYLSDPDTGEIQYDGCHSSTGIDPGLKQPCDNRIVGRTTDKRNRLSKI